MAKSELVFGKLGSSKPTLLASSDSGITSGGFSYDVTPYDYIIVVAGGFRSNRGINYGNGDN